MLHLDKTALFVKNTLLLLIHFELDYYPNEL